MIASRLLRRVVFAVLGLLSTIAVGQIFLHLVSGSGFYGTGLFGWIKSAADSISDKSLEEVARAISDDNRIPPVPTPTPLKQIPAMANRRLDRRVEFSYYLDDILYQSVDGRSRLLIPRRGGWYRVFDITLWTFGEIDVIDDGWPLPRVLTDPQREKYIQHYKKLLLERQDPDAVRELVAFGAPSMPVLIEIIQDEAAGNPSIQKAIWALGRIGSPAAESAVPLLLNIIEGKSPPPGEKPALLGVRDRPVHMEAIRTLGILKASPVRVIPVLMSYLTDPHAGSDAAEAIGMFGSDAELALPDLLKVLKKSNPKIRQAAATAVGRIGPRAASHHASLRVLLKDPSEGIRAAAARSLGQIHAPSAEVMADLKALAGSSDKSSEVKLAAVESLAMLGMPYTEIHPLLVDLYRGNGERFQMAALQAARLYGEASLPFLVERYSYWTRSEVRDSALQWIREIGDNKATLRLGSMLSEADEQQEGAILGMLTQIPELARPLLPSLLKRYRQNQEGRQKNSWMLVANVLVAIPDAAVGPVLAGMNDGTKESVSRAKYVLREMGLAAIPSLAEALKSRNAATRRNALLALTEFGDAAIPVIPAIAQNLSDPDPQNRQSAAAALAKIGLPPQSGIWEDQNIRPAYAHVSSMVPAAPQLIRALGDPNPNVAENAAIALSKIPPDDVSAAVPSLTRLLSSPNRGVRTEAAKTLGFIGPASRTAVSALIQLFREEAARYNMAISEPEALEIAGALSLIGDARAAPAFVEAMKRNPMLFERSRIFNALILLGPASKPVFRDLEQIYKKYEPSVAESDLSSGSYRNYQNFDDAVVYNIRQVFLRMGGPGLEFLEQQMRSKPAFNLSVFGSGPVPPDEISRLLKWLNGDDKRFQYAAVLALGHFGSSAAPAVPGLMELIESDDPHIRHYAIHTLGQIGPAAAPAVDQLVDALSENNLQEVAKLALAGIGKSAIPAVLRMIHKGTDPAKTYDGRCLGLEILRAMGEDVASASGEIAKYVHADISVSSRAFEALGAGGPAGAASAMPEIIRFLKTNPSDGFLQGAVDALGKMGTRAAPAVPELRRILAAGKHEGMRRKIQDLIYRIDLSAPSSGDRT